MKPKAKSTLSFLNTQETQFKKKQTKQIHPRKENQVDSNNLKSSDIDWLQMLWSDFPMHSSAVYISKSEH